MFGFSGWPQHPILVLVYWDVIETLAGLMTDRGVPEHIRSDNRPEFTARAVREWLAGVGAMTLYIEPGSPWENG